SVPAISVGRKTTTTTPNSFQNPLEVGSLMKKSLVLFALALLVSICSPAFAQTPEQMGPPPVLLIAREDIKAGNMPAHSKHSAGYAAAFAKLQTANQRIAVVPVAGSESEVVDITGGGSFADLQKMQRDPDKTSSGFTGA